MTRMILLFTLLLATTIEGVRYEPNWKSIDSRPLPAWFDEAKIGIFLHWGVFSVPSFHSEWFWNFWRTAKSPALVNFMNKNYKPGFTYEEFAPDFTAEFFNPKEWAALFEKSGAKYVVLTSKHHEGYTLWPSKYSFNWNAKDVGPNRDLVGDLAAAVRNTSVRFGLYHSLFEWYNPLYLLDKQNKFKTYNYVNAKARPELEDIVNIYKPDILWSDGDWEAPESYWNSTDILAWLYNDSPVKGKVVVNDRWGSNTPCKHGGFYTCQDRYNPGVLQPRKWENAMTVDKHSWGYRRDAQLGDFLTIDELLTTLVETISCGGNILINVGPTKYGKIAPIFQERLTQLGNWLNVNGEAVYKSKPWKYQKDASTKGVWYTTNNDHVYGMVVFYPNSEVVDFGSVNYDQVDSVQLLGFEHNVTFTKMPNNTGTRVQFPQLTPNSKPHTVFTFKFKLRKHN